MFISSNKKRKLTDKEVTVLEQQRMVAARLAAANSNKATPVIVPPPSSKQAAMVQAKNQSEAIQKVFQPTDTMTATTNIQKRPVIRSKQQTPPTTAAAALAQARARNYASTTTKAKPTEQTNDATQNDKPKPSLILTRKKGLASLLSASMQTTIDATPFYGAVDPEDFWKNLRDWDVLTAYVKEVGANQQSRVSKNEKNEETDSRSKALPDTYISHRHYIASWAPLCLAECRAQMLSELLQNTKTVFYPVLIETPKSNIGSAMDSAVIISKSKNRGQRSDLQFYANDCVVLIPTEHVDLVQRNMKEGDTEKNMRKYGILGHTEHARKGVDGLQLKVSKKHWAKVGGTEMSIWKIGSNITAWREFTALCRVESIPLTRYLLGQQLDGSQPEQQQLASTTKTQLLEKMGGTTALGKGFTAYANAKFNQSQLLAISAAAMEYGNGGFTLIKGPPGTGKTTTLVAVLNSLHIRQFNKYYDEVRRIAAMTTTNRKVALGNAVRAKPRLLVCAPSNAAVDNIILKIMEDGFVDGAGQRYNPSMIRVGVGQSLTVKDVGLELQVDSILEEHLDLAKLDSSVAGYKMELQRIQSDIARLRLRVHALANASPWPLSKDWEIRIDEPTFEETKRVYFVNHKEKTTSFECPPPPEPGETHFLATAMPEYRTYMGRIVKLVESYNSVTSKLERCTIVQSGHNGVGAFQVRQHLETHILDNVHIVMTTLGTAGNRVLEASSKFEVVVVDEAAQSVEPATLSALQLGSKHAILVGDPQQLPATIFSVSGKTTKYDRSLFQRLEESGHKVYMLNEQYRMHPAISHFPRKIFYDGNLLDGPNVKNPEYGNPLRQIIMSRAKAFQPFTILDLDSTEERGGTSLANSAEAHLACYMYTALRKLTNGLSTKTKVAVITPYSQQVKLLRQLFSDLLGESQYKNLVEINTVDAFQGREANIVIFSAVRAGSGKSIGFLSDVRRMNVALTRAKHFLFVIARCASIVVNPYWRDLVEHAKETHAVVPVPMTHDRGRGAKPSFPALDELEAVGAVPKAPSLPRAPTILPSDPRRSSTPATIPSTMRPKPFSSHDPRKEGRGYCAAPPPPPPPPPPPRIAKPPPSDPRQVKQKPTDPRKMV